MCNSLTNASLKDGNCLKVAYVTIYPSITVKKVAYVTQRDEFVTKLITNVAMLTRLNENVSKMQFLDVNVNNILLDKNVDIFFLEEIVSHFFMNINVCTFR